MKIDASLCTVFLFVVTDLFISNALFDEKVEKSAEESGKSLEKETEPEDNEEDVKPPPIIPRKVIFADPDYASVRLSPDGKWLAWVAPYDNVPNIWGKDLPDGEPRTLTKERGRGITSFSWTYRNQTIMYAQLYSQDKDGDENWRLSILDTSTMKTRFLTETFGVKAILLDSSQKQPDKVVIGINNRDPRFYDAYLIDLETGNETLIFQNSGFKSYQFDQDLNIRLLCNETEDAGESFYKYINSTHVEHFKTVSFEDSDVTGPIYFHENGEILYWMESPTPETHGLYEVNLTSNDMTLIYESKQQIATVIGNPVVSLMENYLKPIRIFINGTDSTKNQSDFDSVASLSHDLAQIRKNMPDQSEPLIVSHSSDFSIWLIVPIIDKTPPSYYYFDRKDPNRRVKFLFNYRQTLKSYSLVPMHPVEITSRDGLNLVSYLTLPLESDPKFTSRPSKPVPTILLVHGGPWQRDKWTFDEEILCNKPGPGPGARLGKNGEILSPVDRCLVTFTPISVQYYANRGYAVLQCNFRGSSGFGKKFLNAGNGQWGDRMQNDLTDAVLWAISNNISQPDKIAIVGRSYGGFAVLAGLAFTPDLYACGVDVVGPSNLITMLKSFPPYWKPVYRMMKKRLGGDPYTPDGQKFFRSISPFFHAHKIKRPLLIAQGANDPKVRKFESDQIVDALRNQSVPVTYLVFPNEGHHFVRSENRLAFYAINEKFLADCLGGRSEPMHNDIAQSSVQIT
uniref:Peptidase S9 prolyl oligopeptidase catalytic domain-containing protein n=1 Tax=Romanomermis culicivorax TaxID=13658 RepID=A0A915J3C2_ROMCU